MKKIIIVCLLIILTGCSNEIIEYKKVSDTVVNLSENNNYNKKDLKSHQIKMIDDYINNNISIDLENFIIRSDYYKTNEENTDGVFVKDDKCYINYNDIIFNESNDSDFSGETIIVCNGYYLTLSKDNLDMKKSTQNYRYLGYYDSDKYSFVYRSYTDGSGLILTIGDEINVKFANVDGLDLKVIKTSSNYSFLIIIAVGIIAIVGFVFKKANNNNDVY